MTSEALFEQNSTRIEYLEISKFAKYLHEDNIYKITRSIEQIS